MKDGQRWGNEAGGEAEEITKYGIRCMNVV